jgi:hypothetical protein
MRMERIQSKEFVIAELAANLFGRYFCSPKDANFGGIEDKVLSDLCHHLATQIENYGLEKFSDGVDNEYERLQGRLYD